MYAFMKLLMLANKAHTKLKEYSKQLPLCYVGMQWYSTLYQIIIAIHQNFEI